MPGRGTNTTSTCDTRADSRLAFSQWETAALQNNAAVSLWMGTNLESTLRCYLARGDQPKGASTKWWTHCVRHHTIVFRNENVCILIKTSLIEGFRILHSWIEILWWHIWEDDDISTISTSYSTHKMHLIPLLQLWKCGIKRCLKK